MNPTPGRWQLTTHKAGQNGRGRKVQFRFATVHFGTSFNCRLENTRRRGSRSSLFSAIPATFADQLPPDDQEKCQAAGGDGSIYYFQSYWKLGADEALIVRAPVIPPCESWNFQVSNYWMESLDFRFHRIHINKHSAAYEDDGSVTIVLAHENPGPKYPNYLETAGHSQGGMLFRWIGAEEHPPIEAHAVKFADL